MIINFILHSIHEISILTISTHLERGQETKREDKILMSKLKASEEVPQLR